jgi:hypothetical protein
MCGPDSGVRLVDSLPGGVARSRAVGARCGESVSARASDARPSRRERAGWWCRMRASVRLPVRTRVGCHVLGRTLVRLRRALAWVTRARGGGRWCRRRPLTRT